MKRKIPFAQRIKMGAKSNNFSDVKLEALDRKILQLQEVPTESSGILNTDSIVIESDERGNPCRFTSRLALTDKIPPLTEEYLPKTSSFPQASKKRDSSDYSKSKQFQTKRQKVEEAINNYIPNSAVKLPFYCRVCQLQCSDGEAFEIHRASTAHKDKDSFLRRISYCHQCRKQFTSPEQLKEHKKGKSHLERRNRLTH